MRSSHREQRPGAADLGQVLDGGLDAVAQVQLAEDPLHLRLDGGLLDQESRGDLGVG